MKRAYNPSQVYINGRPAKKQRVALDQSSAVVVPLVQQPALNAYQRKQVKRIVGNKEEKKYANFGIPAASISNVVTTSSLSNIGQGTGESQRIGNVIQNQSLQIKYDLVGSADSTNSVRVIIYKYKGTDALIAPSIVSPTAPIKNGASGGIDYMGFWNEETVPSVYQIIYDRTHILVNGPSATSLRQFVDKYIPLKGKTTFSADGQVSGTNKYYIWYSSDSSAVPHPIMNWQVNLCFTDA